MILSAKVVKRPRKPRYCYNCDRRIQGVAVKLYGMAETGDKPRVSYFHPDCLLSTSDKATLVRLVAAKVKGDSTLTIAAATAQARQELGYA